MHPLLTRTLIAAGLLALTACGGGSSGTAPVNNFGFCGNDTQYALARYNPGGNATIEIVANGNNNTIYNSYQSFDLLLSLSPNSPNANGTVSTGSLTLSSDSSGPHPFSSDYYYTATTQGFLQPGFTYYVWLNAFTSNCVPIGPLGSFVA
jgi:hypothetical protein